MPVFKVTISGEALRRLAETAVAERRPLDLQAEVCVLRQLGCWPEDHSEPITVRGLETQEGIRVAG
jgi:hypothetical protein